MAGGAVTRPNNAPGKSAKSRGKRTDSLFSVYFYLDIMRPDFKINNVGTVVGFAYIWRGYRREKKVVKINEVHVFGMRIIRRRGYGSPKAGPALGNLCT